MDQNEPISTSMLAKIVKFKMVMIKNKDLDRREMEKRLAAAKDSKQRVDSGRAGSKGSARKSASPSKGGKKGELLGVSTKYNSKEMKQHFSLKNQAF